MPVSTIHFAGECHDFDVAFNVIRGEVNPLYVEYYSLLNQGYPTRRPVMDEGYVRQVLIHHIEKQLYDM